MDPFAELRQTQEADRQRRESRRNALLAGATAGVVGGALARTNTEPQVLYPQPIYYEDDELRRDNMKSFGRLLDAQCNLVTKHCDLVEIRIAEAKLALDRAIEEDQERRDRKARNRARNRSYKRHGR